MSGTVAFLCVLCSKKFYSYFIRLSLYL